jgi:glycosyltransferase involved in cell wall biosynthesis
MSENSSTPRVLALIPAYNEARHIAGVVRRSLEFLPVLVVDDGSTDATAKLAQQSGADVLQQQPNQGKGKALMRGFQFALDHDFDAVITLDADGQHDPAEIPLFLKILADTPLDLVIGKRDFRQMPFVRRASNTIGTWLFSWAIGQKINDNQSGYRLISRRLMQEMLQSSEGGFEYEVEMIVRCVQRGMQLSWVPIRTIYADEHSHIRPLHHTRQFLRMVLQTRHSMQDYRRKDKFQWKTLRH